MQELIFSLLIWIGANTSYNIALQPPAIEYQTPEQIKITSGYKSDLIKVAAVYDKGIVFFRAGFNPERLEDRAYLLHELAHYVQDKNDAPYRKCKAEWEPEAYRLTNKFFTENGLEPPYAESFIVLMAICPAEKD